MSKPSVIRNTMETTGDKKNSSSLDKSRDTNDFQADANSSSKENYEFDDLLRLVGGFGRYPMLLYAFMCLMTVPIGLQQLVLVFYGASPPFQCVASSTTMNSSNCEIDKCCANCTEYEFKGKYTSAVSEVSLSLKKFITITTLENIVFWWDCMLKKYL